MLDSTVDLWATDEVHFQQHESRCRMGIPPEIKDPILFHAPHAEERGVLRRRALTGRQVLVPAGSGRFVAHRAWWEQHAAEFALDFLPPYSPELYPIERVWKNPPSMPAQSLL